MRIVELKESWQEYSKRVSDEFPKAKLKQGEVLPIEKVHAMRTYFPKELNFLGTDTDIYVCKGYDKYYITALSKELENFELAEEELDSKYPSYQRAERGLSRVPLHPTYELVYRQKDLYK